MFAIILYIIIFFVFWVLNTNIFKERLNYANIFLLFWCIIPSLSTIGLFRFYVPPFLTHVYIYLMIVVFETVTILGKTLRFSKHNYIYIKERPSTERISWKLMSFISLICMLAIIPYFYTAFRFLIGNGYYYLRLRVLGNELYTTRDKIILQSIIQPLIIMKIEYGIR